MYGSDFLILLGAVNVFTGIPVGCFLSHRVSGWMINAGAGLTLVGAVLHLFHDGYLILVGVI